MKNEINIFEHKEGGTDKPLFQIRATEFGVICDSKECESIYWYDNMGSVGKFYNLRGLNFEESKTKENSFNQLLLNFNLNNKIEIERELTGLLQILPKGKYSCNYLEPEEGHQENGFNFYNIIFPLYDKSISDENEVRGIFAKHFDEKIQERGNYLPPDYLHNSAINFYDGYESHILATKHERMLDENRVRFYKNEINKGKNPPLIVFTGIEEHGITNSFIIDGHHKAKAYIELKKNPFLINLTGGIFNSKNTLSDLKQTSNILYKEQMVYLIGANYQFEEIIKEICSDNYLKEYCLNGKVERFYPTGKLQMRGNYVESKRHGEFIWYFPDGTLEKRVKYEMGQWKSTYEQYFHNGKLLIRGDDNGVIEQYDIYGNRTK